MLQPIVTFPAELLEYCVANLSSHLSICRPRQGDRETRTKHQSCYPDLGSSKAPLARGAPVRARRVRRARRRSFEEQRDLVGLPRARAPEGPLGEGRCLGTQPHRRVHTRQGRGARPPRKRSTRSPPMRRQKPTSGSWTDSSHRPGTAKNGGGTGSTSSATPRRTATSAMARSLKLGATATT